MSKKNACGNNKEKEKEEKMQDFLSVHLFKKSNATHNLLQQQI